MRRSRRPISPCDPSRTASGSTASPALARCRPLPGAPTGLRIGCDQAPTVRPPHREVWALEQQDGVAAAQLAQGTVAGQVLGLARVVLADPGRIPPHLQWPIAGNIQPTLLQARPRVRQHLDVDTGVVRRRQLPDSARLAQGKHPAADKGPFFA